MKPAVRSLAVLLCLLLTVTQIPSVAQTANPPTSQTPSQPGLDSRGPVPAQIATAHGVFLSNAGADTSFPIDATEAYNDVYKALESWGRYQMVSSPDKADLILQLRGVYPFHLRHWRRCLYGQQSCVPADDRGPEVECDAVDHHIAGCAGGKQADAGSLGGYL